MARDQRWARWAVVTCEQCVPWPRPRCCVTDRERHSRHWVLQTMTQPATPTGTRLRRAAQCLSGHPWLRPCRHHSSNRVTPHTGARPGGARGRCLGQDRPGHPQRRCPDMGWADRGPGNGLGRHRHGQTDKHCTQHSRCQPVLTPRSAHAARRHTARSHLSDGDQAVPRAADTDARCPALRVASAAATRVLDSTRGHRWHFRLGSRDPHAFALALSSAFTPVRLRVLT